MLIYIYTVGETLYMNIISGVSSGVVASAIANPTDVLKVKYMHLYHLSIYSSLSLCLYISCNGWYINIFVISTSPSLSLYIISTPFSFMFVIYTLALIMIYPPLSLSYNINSPPLSLYIGFL